MPNLTLSGLCGPPVSRYPRWHLKSGREGPRQPALLEHFGGPACYYMCAFIICAGLWLWGAAASTILASFPPRIAHAWVQEPEQKRKLAPEGKCSGNARACRSTTSRRRTGFRQPGAMSELRTRTGSSILAFRPRSTTHATSRSASFIAGFSLLSRWLIWKPPARRFVLRAVLQ